MRTIGWLGLGLVACGPCGPPWVMVDCAPPGLQFTVETADGALTQATEIRFFQDDALTETIACAPGGSDCMQGRMPVFEAGSYRVEVDVAGQTFSHAVDVAADELGAGACCGGFFGDATIVVAGCATLAPVDCATTDGCAIIDAAPVTEAACVDVANPVDVGCRDAHQGCDEAETWARLGDGPCWWFSNGCLPIGWATCEPQDEPFCE